MTDRISTVGDSFSTVKGIQYIGEITSLCAGDNISTVGDNISTVEGIQYSGRFRHVWPLIMTKRYRHFLYYDTKFSKFRKFWQISCLLRAGLVYSRSNLASK